MPNRREACLHFAGAAAGLVAWVGARGAAAQSCEVEFDDDGIRDALGYVDASTVEGQRCDGCGLVNPPRDEEGVHPMPRHPGARQRRGVVPVVDRGNVRAGLAAAVLLVACTRTEPAPEAVAPAEVPEPSGTAADAPAHEESAEPAPTPPPEPTPVWPDDPLALHAQATVIDLHVDSLWQIHRHGYAFAEPPEGRFVDPGRMRAGGVDAQFFSVWVPPDSDDPVALGAELLDLFDREIVAATPDLDLVTDPDALRETVAAGRMAALLGLEGCTPLGDDPDNLRAYAARGVRYVSLTWNERNAFGDGALVDDPHGITDAGRRLVRLAEELGVVVDVSHTSAPLFWDVMATADLPVVASHSDAAALTPHRRNLDDVQLWALADAGGVVGLNFYPEFLASDGEASRADVVAHALHIRAVAGAEHLALGSDFDGLPRGPEGLEDIAAMPTLTADLAAAGFGPDELVGLLGENLLRVLDAVHAREPRAPTLLPVVGVEGVVELLDHSALTAVPGLSEDSPARLTSPSAFDRVTVCVRGEAGASAHVHVATGTEGALTVIAPVELDGGIQRVRVRARSSDATPVAVWTSGAPIDVCEVVLEGGG